MNITLKIFARGAYSEGVENHHIKKFQKSQIYNIEFEAYLRSGSRCSGSEHKNMIIAVCLLGLLRGVPAGGVPACVENRVNTPPV